MLDHELGIAGAPNESKRGERFNRAKSEWEKAQRAFRQSFAVLCRIVESESRSFPEAKMPLIEADLRACLVKHRDSSHKDFAQSLQDLVNQKYAELLAAWWRELADPAAAYVQDSISRFNDSGSDIVQRISGVHPIDSGLRTGQAEGPLLPMRDAVHSRSQIPEGWFRRRMLRRALSQLKADVEITVNRLGRMLVEQIQHRAATAREMLQYQLETVLSDAMKSTAPDSHTVEGPLLCAIAEPASTVLLPCAPAVAGHVLARGRCGPEQSAEILAALVRVGSPDSREVLLQATKQDSHLLTPCPPIFNPTVRTAMTCAVCYSVTKPSRGTKEFVLTAS